MRATVLESTLIIYATGDAVNVAARLEQAANPEEILLGEATYQLVRAAVRVESVERLSLRGKAEPVAAYRLARILEGAPAVVRRFDSPFVGRGGELDGLRRSFERAAAEGVALLVTLLGPAGIGKTRLVDEFARSATPAASNSLCSPHSCARSSTPPAAIQPARSSAIAAEGRLAGGWSVDAAADLLYTVTMPGPWRELTRELGWRPDHYAEHRTRMLRRSLLSS